MKKRYSYLIRPIQVIIDLLLINSIIYYIYDKEFLNFFFLTYISIFWLISSISTGFYNVFRFTNKLRILSLLAKQFLILT